MKALGFCRFNQLLDVPIPSSGDLAGPAETRAYQPDLNPIEQAFSKMKGLLCKVGARSREALIEVMGKVLGATTSRDAKGFFEPCGCRSLGQPL